MLPAARVILMVFPCSCNSATRARSGRPGPSSASVSVVAFPTNSSINDSAILEYSRNHPGEEITMVYDNTLSDDLLRCLDIVLDSDAQARNVFETRRLTFETKLRAVQENDLYTTMPHDEAWVDKYILTPLMDTLMNTVQELCVCSNTTSPPKRENIIKPDYICSGMIGEWKSPYKLPAAAIDMKRRIDEIGVLLLNPGTTQSDNWAWLANKVT